MRSPGGLSPLFRDITSQKPTHAHMFPSLKQARVLLVLISINVSSGVARSNPGTHHGHTAVRAYYSIQTKFWLICYQIFLTVQAENVYSVCSVHVPLYLSRVMDSTLSALCVFAYVCVCVCVCSHLVDDAQ